jgi:chromosome segregation ATPase
MASDNSAQTLANEEDAAALALEVKALRALLEELQAELRPAVQSSLRERSSELQRAGADLAERQAEIERLQAALAAAETRAAALEDEAARWREAARRGLDEIAERALKAQARFELETGELNQALTAAKAQLEAARAEARTIAQARDEAREEAERRQRRIRSLKAKVVRREQRRMQMTRSLSWRITAPLRWIPAALGRLLLGGARLRRRMLKR